MEVLLGFFGLLAGAALTIVGQLGVRRREERERWVSVLLEDCARLYALEDEFTGAVQAAFGEQPDRKRLEAWPRSERASCGARLQIVCTDPALLNKIDALHASGRDICAGRRHRWCLRSCLRLVPHGG